MINKKELKKCEHKKVEEMLWGKGERYQCKECGEPVVKVYGKWVSVYKENR